MITEMRRVEREKGGRREGEEEGRGGSKEEGEAASNVGNIACVFSRFASKHSGSTHILLCYRV